MYSWIKDLYPIPRSIVGPGFNKSLLYLQSINSELKILKIKTGTKVFDWTIPKEWWPYEAYICNLKNKKLVDFNDNNLHLVSHSVPVNKRISLKELEKKLFYIKEMPNAIPYVTSYYNEDWGFCLTYNQRKKLTENEYHVVINTELKDGFLRYGEFILPGKERKEIMFSSYLCHPSMANNELSGPALLSALMLHLKSLKERRFTYRILILPETIGSIAYISKNKNKLIKNTLAAFNVTCVGDDNQFSFLPSKYNNSYTDKVAEFTLKDMKIRYKKYKFSDRGSDERQFSGPLMNLPMVSIMRTKYGEYPEYHTSQDNLNYISVKGLEGSYEVYKSLIEVIESNFFYMAKKTCEPFLSRLSLYPKNGAIHGQGSKIARRLGKDINNFLTYADGTNDLIDISQRIDLSFEECLQLVKILKENNLIE